MLLPPTGSAVAIIGMPLIALIKRDDRVAGIAWIFLFGSAAGAFTTLCFCYVLCRFPRFVRQVESEGADGGVIGRLTKYYKLNVSTLNNSFEEMDFLLRLSEIRLSGSRFDSCFTFLCSSSALMVSRYRLQYCIVCSGRICLSPWLALDVSFHLR